MKDLSQFTDEELLKIAKPNVQQKDLSSYSDEKLMQIAGIKSPTENLSQLQKKRVMMGQPDLSPEMEKQYQERLKRGEKVYAETISPILSGLSTFAFGIPKAIVEKVGAKEEIFPEQKTFMGKALRTGTELGGLTTGGAATGGKLLLKTTKRVIPRLAGKGAVKQAIRGGIFGAGMGMLQTPTKGEGVIRPKERLEQSKVWGMYGGAIPLGIGGVRYAGGKIGGFFTKSGRWVAKNIGGITDATVKTIKRLGAKRVFEPIKAKADYVVQNLVPRVQRKFQESVSKFTAPIQKFAKEKLKMPTQAIDSIKKKGIENIQRIRMFYDDSTDAFYRKIQQGFVNKRNVADKAYQEAMDAIPDNSLIPIKNTFYTLRNILKKYKFIDNQGNLLGRVETIDDPVYKKLIGLYDDMKNSLVTQGKQRATGAVLKTDFEIYRDMLGRLYKERPTDRWIRSIRNSLYDDAERAGMKGLQQARILERQAFEAEEKLLKGSLIKERKLDNFYKLTQEEVRQLKEIESYIGENFVDDLESLTAARYLDKFQQYTPDKFARDLIKAKNPNWTQYIEKEYKDLLGAEDMKDIWDDLMAHFANIDFELVTETPGAGGGFYPSKAGMLRSIIGKGAKKYYKDISPLIQRTPKFMGRPLERLEKFIE